mgnify:CR=1 FL=1
MKAVIFSGGRAPSLSLVKSELEDADVLIAVDSGGNYLRDNGIIPDFLVGDFDSINPVTLEFFRNSSCKVHEYPKDKDFTDTELALELAVKLNSDTIIFLGCTGTRLDHVIGNLGLLRTCIEMEISGYIKDDHNIIMLSKAPLKLTGKRGSTFSVQAFCDTVNNLSIKGAKYPLYDHKLILGDPLTISNEFLDEEVEIYFTDGLLMVLYSRD